jgi:hypothetical protein
VLSVRYELSCCVLLKSELLSAVETDVPDRRLRMFLSLPRSRACKGQHLQARCAFETAFDVMHRKATQESMGWDISQQPYSVLLNKLDGRVEAAVTLQARIREVLGSNPSPNTCYPL